MVNTKRAFTLIELLTVISIIGILSSVVIGNLLAARERGRIAAGLTAQSSIHGAYGADAVAFFDFEDSTATTIRDSLGNGYSIPMPSGCSLVDDSPSGGGKSLECTNTRFTFLPNSQADSSATDDGQSYSFALWFKPTGPLSTNQGRFIGRTFGGRDTFIQMIGASRTIWGSIISNTLVSQIFTNTLNNVSIGKWSFIVFSVDSVSDKARIYVDGKEIYSAAFNNPFILRTFTMLDPYYVGGTTVIGRYDKVGFYRKALGLAEVQDMYLAQKAKMLANNK